MNIEKELARLALTLYLQGKYSLRQVAHTLGKAQENIKPILSHLMEEEDKAQVLDVYASYIITV